MRWLSLAAGAVDLVAHEIRREDEALPLSPMECALLRYLAARPGRVVPQEELLREVWKYSERTLSRTVRSTVHRLRTKIERDPRNPDHLLTVHGQGYRFRPQQAPEVPIRPPRRAPDRPDRDVHGIIDQIYEAGLDPDRWRDALASLTAAVGAEGTSLEVYDGRTGEMLFFDAVELPEKGIAAYVTHFHQLCPRLPEYRSTPGGTVHFDYRFTTDTEMDRHPFYADFLRPWGLRYYVGGTLVNDEELVGIFAAHRTARAGHAGEEECRVAAVLMPHLCRAVQMNQRLGIARDARGALVEALEQWDGACAVIDRRGRLLLLNAAGRRLEADGVLTTREGRLAVRGGADAELQRLLADAVASPRTEGRGSGGTVRIGAPKASLTALIAPLPTGRREPFLTPGREPAALVLLTPA